MIKIIHCVSLVIAKDGEKPKCLSTGDQLNELWEIHAVESSPRYCDNSKRTGGPSLVVQWLRLRPSTAGGMGSIPGRGTKISHAARCSQTNK